ncbi:hypothetical protein ACFW60_04375, partial [Streptomyces sp. NPDC058726]
IHLKSRRPRHLCISDSLPGARSRESVDVRPYVDALHGFRSRTWTVDELVLVRSRLPRSGVPGEQPRYEAVARRALGAAG